MARTPSIRLFRELLEDLINLGLEGFKPSVQACCIALVRRGPVDGLGFPRNLTL